MSPGSFLMTSGGKTHLREGEKEKEGGRGEGNMNMNE